LASAQLKTGVKITPTMNSALTSSAARTCWISIQKPSGNAGSVGALGCTSGLPR